MAWWTLFDASRHFLVVYAQRALAESGSGATKEKELLISICTDILNVL